MSIALMNEMLARGHEVHLVTWDRPESQGAFFAMASGIVWHRIGVGDHLKKASLFIRLERMSRFRTLVRSIRPNIAIGFQHGAFLAARLYALGLGVPTICAERNSPSRMVHTSGGEKPWKVFQTMRLAEKITVQCPSYREMYPPFLRGKIAVIPNPVFPASQFANPQNIAEERKTLLSVGRLSYQKNYACLIEAFSRIADRLPDWDLLIAGEGEDRATLESLIRALNLSGRVSLPGAVSHDRIGGLYARAQLFCLPSRWEGFPNALAESLAHGLPAVGFAGCDGVRDLISHGENGLLVQGNGDADSLAVSLLEAMKDDPARARMGAKARESVAQYVPEKIFDLWEEVFRDVSGIRP